MSNERKLMPYEHQLVDALGISKQEYLDFVAQQHAYTDPKEGTILDARNDFVAVSLVLTIVGTILQVVGALLVKEDEGGSRTQSRDRVFAPRSGFNSLQQLAEYGDPVHLVYTDINSNKQGGVRITTSLLWSAVKSFGSSQYVQLLLLIGAGSIGEIDADRSAFGQTPMRDLIAQNYWLYFEPNGTGAIRAKNLLQGSEYKRDPGIDGSDGKNIYRISGKEGTKMIEGFSHAVSPSTSNVFGAYGPVPINVDVIVRNEAGREESANNEIKVESLPMWGPSDPNSVNKIIREDETFSIVLKETKLKEEEVVKEEANNRRRSLAPVFDNAAIFKLGSAKFSVMGSSAGSTDEGDVVVYLRCVEGGRAPSTPYSANTPEESAKKLQRKTDGYEELEREVRKLLTEDTRTTIKNAADLLKDGRIFTTKKVNFGGRGAYRSVFKRNLTKENKEVLQDFIEISSGAGVSGDDRFFTKALVKVEMATYETISPCHIVDLALRARVFRRINGRQEKYGSKRVDGYPTSDNGLKQRSAMFLVKYKKRGGRYLYVKGIFVVRRAADVDNYIYLRFNSGENGADNANIWSFELEPIHDTIAEIKTYSLETNGVTRFFYLENTGKERTINLDDDRSFSFTGATVNSGNMLPPRNNSPEDTNEWDLFSHTTDTQLQMSFDQGPEFTLTAVTEQIVENFRNYPGLYDDLSLAGFNMYSGRNVQDLRSLSMFVNQGRRCRLLRTSGTVKNIGWGQPRYQYLPPSQSINTSEMVSGTSYLITTIGNSDWAAAGLRKPPAVGEVFIAKVAVAGTGRVRAGGYANRAPDIFLDTILDGNDGIGKYSGDLFAVDIEQLSRSKKFCERNKLFMDGLIAEPESWREFWANNAPFSLLELAKIDGREALIPGVPYDKNSGKIASKETLITVPIAALFNQGNILEGSYKEEFIDYGTSTEDVIVTIIYRDNERDGAFPRKNSVEIKLKSANEDSALRESIDASQFVTNKAQAILLGKLLCQTRRHSRRSIEFKTFPTDSYVGPSAYIYVELAQNQWDEIYSGTIGKGGELNLPIADAVKNGDYQFLLYNPNSTYSEGAGDDRCPGETEDNKKATGTLFRSAIAVTNGRAEALRRLEGYVFVLGKVIRNKRTFRVTEVSMDEEGEVTVRAVEHPTDEDGYSLITKGLASDDSGLFRIDGRAE
jgi:hypothetical protein